MPSNNSSPKATLLCVGDISYSGSPLENWTVFGIIPKYQRLQSRQKLKKTVSQNITLSLTLRKSPLKCARAHSVHPDYFEKYFVPPSLPIEMKLEILRIFLNSVTLRGINMRRKNENHVMNLGKRKKKTKQNQKSKQTQTDKK